MKYLITYVCYNNKDFKKFTFAENEEEKKRIVDGLKKLAHVAEVRVKKQKLI